MSSSNSQVPLAASGSPSASGQVSARGAALSLLLRLGEATASQLAKDLDVSVQVMRRHLRSLEDEGLVAASPAPEGPGRPSNRWHLTPEGRGQFPDGSQQFALGLLASLAGNLPEKTLNQLMTLQAQSQALSYLSSIGDGPLQERLQRLVELRRMEGYVGECVPHSDGHSWLISEFHCSVMSIAEQFPCVCDQELQLIRQTFPDCEVERVQWRLEQGHSCGFRLSPAAPKKPT
jgi:DeoR family suf operon transcriptional repressor